MIFNIENIRINLEWCRKGSESRPLLFFIHGFSGSAGDWASVIPLIDNRFPAAAVDLVGHGKSDSPAEVIYYRQDSIVKQIYEIITQTGQRKIILIGYSMGGRAALSFSIKDNGMIEGIILESSSAGIEDEESRSERIKKDEGLAEFITSHTIEEFADYWMNLEIFSTQKNIPADKLKKIKEDKLNNNKTGLANSLKGFSTGRMTPLYNKLKDIKAETLLITGTLDEKFTSLNSRMRQLFNNAGHKIINNAGHNVHLEQPAAFAEAINSFLKKF